jgi:NADH-quinone oxidoreductase subunit L
VPFDTFALILLFPLVGVLLNALIGKRLPLNLSGGIATLAIGLSFVWSLRAFLVLRALPAAEQRLLFPLWEWFGAGDFAVDFSLLLDPLSSVMILVVTGVGALIHLYSIGYMSHDKDYPRFFAYLNLFTLAMLLLVLGSNYLVLFVGWEGVGLCSYLLIGLW